MRKRFWSILGSALCAAALSGSLARAGIDIQLESDAPEGEKRLAEELTGYLQRLYPATRELKISFSTHLAEPESYQVEGQGRELSIRGGGLRGLYYGTYGLLERLGCGFYLSGDALPAPRKEPLVFENLAFGDKPVVAQRLVFNWHNFLSGCSTWNLPEWQQWTSQSQKMGFNAIMVHAYGNNPMVSFTFNGKVKPVGYLTSSFRGRDWNTEHVNDVRRLIGGEIFSEPVFGADAALVPLEQRADAARALMQKVFAHAAGRGMRIYFANDIDTISANPQELILTLPENARFVLHQKSGDIWLANPDSPQGYEYYLAQARQLLADYPQITDLVLWHRTGGTPWMDMPMTRWPAAWQPEYMAGVSGEKKPDSPVLRSQFVLAKVVKAWQKALVELRRQDVAVEVGTWNFGFIAAADRFMPPGVGLIDLDYDVLEGKSKLGTAEHRKELAAVAAHRPFLPVIWAHHDDGAYMGRSYTPFTAFAEKLQDTRAAGYGIIHWTTRPLDLYFTSHARQVWQSHVNEALDQTCRTMAGHLFGQVDLGRYFQDWITHAPLFSRATAPQFLDRPLVNPAQVIADSQKRQAMLAGIPGDAAAYYRGMEEFMGAFYRTHGLYEQAEARWKAKDFDGARQILADAHPEEVIATFARAASVGGMTRGEQGILIRMNTNWRVYFLRMRQALGLEPIRLRFAPTSHEPLAMSPGKATYYVDAERQLWEVLGSEELRAPVDEVAGSFGLRCDQERTIKLSTIAGPAMLAPGRYRVKLSMRASQSAGLIRLGVGETSCEVDLTKEKAAIEREMLVELKTAQGLELSVRPVQGQGCLLSSVLVEPLR